MKNLLTILAFISTSCFAQHYPIKNMLGIDCHPWDLIASNGTYGDAAKIETANKQNAITSTGFTWLRVYVDAGNIKDTLNTVYGFNPTINRGGGYMLDDAFASLESASGIKVNYCYQNAPLNIQKEYSVDTTKNTQYRHRYTENWDDLANDMAVIAGRYGSNVNAPNYPLFVSSFNWEPKQLMLKGTKLVNQVEAGNEYDNKYSNVYPLTAAQYVALWRLVYNKVKAVDPSMVVSTTGVMTADPQMLIDVLKASSGNIPFDKYQFHLYPWGWPMYIASAFPPERSMIPDAKKIVAAANGIPCFIGEWGYDLHPLSDIGIRPFSNYTAEEIRSFWIERSILGFAAAGIESAFYYRMYQDYGLLNDNNSQTFETSSLFIKDDQNNITRRLSGDVFYNLSRYGDFVFDKAMADNDSVKVYRFKSGVSYLYTGWTVEKVQLVTIDGVNRASFTERKISYTFPDGQTKELSSRPVDFVTSISLPIDTTSYKPPAPAPQFVDVRVFDFMGRERKDLNRKHVQLQQFKIQLPRHKFFILRWWDGKQYYSDKIFNL